MTSILMTCSAHQHHPACAAVGSCNPFLFPYQEAASCRNEVPSRIGTSCSVSYWYIADVASSAEGLYIAAQYQLHDWHAGGSAQASSTAVATSVSQVVATALAKALANVSGTASSG